MGGGNREVLAGSIRARLGALAMRAGYQQRSRPVMRARGAAHPLLKHKSPHDAGTNWIAPASGACRGAMVGGRGPRRLLAASDSYSTAWLLVTCNLDHLDLL